MVALYTCGTVCASDIFTYFIWIAVLGLPTNESTNEAVVFRCWDCANRYAYTD